MTQDHPDLVLRDVLDASFGDGPALPPPTDRLAHGRRALRRRRVGAAGAIAVVTAFATTAALSGSGGAPRGAVDPAGPAPTASAPTTPTDPASPAADQGAEGRPEPRPQHRLVSQQFPASLDSDGSLVVKDGWRVTQRVDEPLGHQPPEASLGVVVTDGERTRWMLLTLDRIQDAQGRPIGDEVAPSASADDAGKGYSRFEDWLASMVDLSGGPRSAPLVTITEADAARPGPGVSVVEVRDAPIIDDYTSEGDRLVQVVREGRTWFVVVRGHGPRAEVIPVDADVLAAPTFEALVDHLAQQADSGEGVR